MTYDKTQSNAEISGFEGGKPLSELISETKRTIDKQFNWLDNRNHCDVKDRHRDFSGMNIYCDINVRYAQLSRLLGIDLEVFKMYLELDFNEGALKKLKFCV